MKKTCVKLDLPRLSLRLSQESDRQIGLGDVHTWLHARGFKMAGDWWACGDADLSKLRADEITTVRLEVKDGPVTFVETRPA
jgi:hypothetical protein